MDGEGGEYIKDLRLYQRKFGFMATSVDLKLKIILAKMEIEPPKTLSEKVEDFLTMRSEVKDGYSGDLDELAEKLLQFNRYWMTIDTGSEAPVVQMPAVSSQGKIVAFGRSQQAEIDADFTEIMEELSKISDNL